MVPVDLTGRAVRGALAALAVGALLVAACGSDGSDGGGPGATSPSAATSATGGGEPAPDDLAATVAAATEAAGRARFVMETVAEADGEEAVASRSEGEVDWVARRGHRVDRFDEVLLTTGRPGDGLTDQGEAWLAGDRTWEVNAGDPASEAHPVTPGLGPFLGLHDAGEGDGLAGALLATLDGRRFESAGTEDVGGAIATRYRAEDGGRTVEVWVDGGGRLVRLRQGSTAPTGAVLATVLELSDLGGDVEVPPLPDGIG